MACHRFCVRRSVDRTANLRSGPDGNEQRRPDGTALEIDDDALGDDRIRVATPADTAAVAIYAGAETLPRADLGPERVRATNDRSLIVVSKRRPRTGLACPPPARSESRSQRSS
jgi:hypothetical protein